MVQMMKAAEMKRSSRVGYLKPNLDQSEPNWSLHLTPRRGAGEARR